MSLRHAVLGLLDETPASGYDLLKRFEQAMGNVWHATQSQLYGELGKLEAAELIEVASEGPRGRKEYAITAAGRAELRRWLVDVKPAATPRNETLLRVYFLGAAGPERAREYLTWLGEVAREREKGLLELEESIDWGEGDAYLYGRLVLEWGKRFLAMQRDWSTWAVAQVEKSV
jgi:DNA-binding PadR family transcriptional regulator